jgi:hypothetical protein
MPDNETINKRIAKMMGVHWHDYGSGDRCACGVRSHDDEFDGEGGPEYTSDDSPRRLLNEAVDKAVEMVGESAHVEALLRVIYADRYDENEEEFDVIDCAAIANASAQQIATAIYNATKEEGE